MIKLANLRISFRATEFILSILVPLTVLVLSAALLFSATVLFHLDASASTTAAEQKNQKTFVSPEAAGNALAAAWRSDSEDDLVAIFGAVGVDLVNSGDPIADREARKRLAAAYDARHRFEKVGEEAAQFIIGEQEFPYPIPLVKRGNGWYFDTAAGAEEILDRRIGRNELNAIEVCRAYVEAQREYAASFHEYARKIESTSGTHDGLYWPTKESEKQSPLGPLIAHAADEGYGSGPAEAFAYHGYYYRILTRQGEHAPGGLLDYVVGGRMTAGFALLAFPAKYGNSGIMTFIVNQDGIVFEKNLGPETASIARKISQYDPDASWKIHN